MLFLRLIFYYLITFSYYAESGDIWSSLVLIRTDIAVLEVWTLAGFEIVCVIYFP